ncbi:MAG: hypothetical protein RI935_149 [Candidatus Parcubacteria bacterium]|jgi:hypothetical protein
MYKKLLFSIGIVISTWHGVYAVSFEVNAPTIINGVQVVPVTVYMDSEGSVVSGVSGSISFPEEMLSLYTISLYDSIVPLWVTQPTLQKDTLNKRSTISFEGIFIGGWSHTYVGSGNPFTKGKLFTILLTPKSNGKGVILFDNVQVHAFDEKATVLTSRTKEHMFTITNVANQNTVPALSLNRKDINSIELLLMDDSSLESQKTYITLTDTKLYSPIRFVKLIQSNESTEPNVTSSLWQEISLPYVISKERGDYIHLYIEYMSGDYTIKTISTVENLNTKQRLFSILNSIIVSVLLVLASVVIIIHAYRHPLNKK